MTISRTGLFLCFILIFFIFLGFNYVHFVHTGNFMLMFSLVVFSIFVCSFTKFYDTNISVVINETVY